jgi:hypothetical protein
LHPIDLRFVMTPWGACSKKQMDTSDPEIKEVLEHILKEPLTRQPDVFIQMTIPSEYVQPAKFNIGITAGIESTIPRPEWLERMNLMQLNIVLSQFNKEVFTKAKFNKKLPNGQIDPLELKTPIEIVPWGADTNIYKKTDEKVASLEDSLKDIPEQFCFLFVGQWTSGNMRADRKAIGFLLKTFLETFANVNNPPALILKTSGAQICIMDKYDCLAKINDVTNMVKQALPPGTKLPNVYLLHGELEDNEMNALYNHEKVKVHVSFSHGEGFGHPLLLATLSGKPLLASHWSGHLDFLNPKLTKFFEGNIAPIPDEAINDWFVKDARWFDVDYATAGQKMKYYFNNYEGKILEDAETLRKENVEKFSLEAMDKSFHAMLDKYIPKFAEEAPVKLPVLKKLNLPTAYNGKEAVQIMSGEPSSVKTASPTTLTKA